MTDLKFRFSAEGVADIAIANGDLELDETLETAVLISLFTDGRADEEDALPDFTTDRRGWWAAELLDSDDGNFGSLLWLLERSKLTAETMREAEVRTRTALGWLLDEDVAEALGIDVSRLGADRILVSVEIIRGNAKAFPRRWAAFADVEIEAGSSLVVNLARR